MVVAEFRCGGASIAFNVAIIRVRPISSTDYVMIATRKCFKIHKTNSRRIIELGSGKLPTLIIKTFLTGQSCGLAFLN